MPEPDRAASTGTDRSRRARWPLAGIVAGIASFAGAIASLSGLTDEQHLEGVGLVDRLERSGYHLSFLLGMIGVAALFITAAGWRRWAAHNAADDLAAGLIATALQATATVNIIGYSLAGAVALYLPGGMDDSSTSDEQIFVNFAYLDFGTLFGWWGAVLAAGCVAAISLRRRLLPRWMGIASVLLIITPIGFAVTASLPGMPGFFLPIWLVAISAGMAASRGTGTGRGTDAVPLARTTA